MAKNDNVLGVAKIEIGAPGDGVMGTSLTEFNVVELNSTNFDGSEANEETITTEQEDAYLTLSAAANPNILTFRLFEVFGDALVLLMGGTYTDGTKTWDAPESIADTYLSVRLTSKAINGFYMTIEFPYAKISARHQGTITKNNLLAIDVTATANTPVSAGGTKGAPYTIKKVAVT
jgi:hypothetical protein